VTIKLRQKVKLLLLRPQMRVNGSVKHQPEYRRQWRKLHMGIDAKTLQIRAVQLTTNNVSGFTGTW
jgi:hypothetical protein